MVDPVSAATSFWDLKASNILKFITDFVSAVAWPVGAAFIVSIFKNEIIERIPRLSELTLPGGISAKFNEGLNKVEADLAAKLPPEEIEREAPVAKGTDKSLDGAPGSPDELEASVPISPASRSIHTPEEDPAALRANPAGVVMVAWQRLDQALRLFASNALNSPTSELTDSYVIATLRNKGFITSDEEAALMKLRELRNLAAHFPKNAITALEAKRFVKVAEGFRKDFVEKSMRDSIEKAKSRVDPNV